MCQVISSWPQGVVPSSDLICACRKLKQKVGTYKLVYQCQADLQLRVHSTWQQKWKQQSPRGCFFPLCFLNMLVSKGSRSGSQNKRRSSPAQLTSSPRRRLLSSFMTSKRQADEEVGLPKQSSATKRIPQALLEYLILIFFMFYIANICGFFFFCFLYL